jgi:hypothetical protein
MPVVAPKLRNIGPKSAAWLRQVGLRTEADLVAVGPVEAYMRVRRAGFKPTLNLLYALEGALRDCHWQEVPEPRRLQLAQEAEAAIALLPPPRYKPAAAPETTTVHMHEEPALDIAGDEAQAHGDLDGDP